MIDVIIPVILGSCAVGLALMAWRAYHNPPEIIGRNEATRRLLALTDTDAGDAPVPVRERK